MKQLPQYDPRTNDHTPNYNRPSKVCDVIVVDGRQVYTILHGRDNQITGRKTYFTPVEERKLLNMRDESIKPVKHIPIEVWSEVVKELKKVPNHTSVNLYIRDRINQLTEASKETSMKVDPTNGEPLPTESEIYHDLNRLINKRKKHFNTATELSLGKELKL